MDGSPILFLSRLARHTKNIDANPRASLLLEDANLHDPLEGARVSLSGTLSRTEESADARRFLARHSAVASYAGFSDSGFFRMAVSGAHLVAGFGGIADLKAEDVLTEIGDATPLAAGEENAIAHMNMDHRDAIALYATKLLGEAAGDWRMVSIDPEGCDLMLGGRTRRLEFLERVTEPEGLRQILVKLANEAR